MIPRQIEEHSALPFSHGEHRTHPSYVSIVIGEHKEHSMRAAACFQEAKRDGGQTAQQ
jgi:hypothetical protein